MLVELQLDLARGLEVVDLEVDLLAVGPLLKLAGGVAYSRRHAVGADGRVEADLPRVHLLVPAVDLPEFLDELARGTGHVDLRRHLELVELLLDAVELSLRFPPEITGIGGDLDGDTADDLAR
ncbi:hypothetical protein [Streptomyces albospinus]|uniref:hypothetical protein n=1 Tax=Streptomyces albospinus TaxID=285515 RepID=UPI001E39CBEB|nr:hypothetical protein [Streptomyces albospinus]